MLEITATLFWLNLLLIAVVMWAVRKPGKCTRCSGELCSHICVTRKISRQR